MASQGYRDWLRAGQPYDLIRPAAAVQATLRGYGLTVYDYPNDAHLQASTPEDHTPFSVTGWPGTNVRWNARALDVMPRDGSAAARKENADIARQLIRDRDALVPGAMWIKYLNWTNEDGVCRQERWTDADRPWYRTGHSSTDKGHIHISGRSDADDDDRADDYDPIARMRGTLGSDDMSKIIEDKIDALYNARDLTTLDGGGKQQFVVPLVALIKGQHAETLTMLAKVGEAAGIDATELDAIRASAAAGVDAALLAGQERLITAIRTAVVDMISNRDEADLTDDAIEDAVRRVFADAATPDA